MNNCAFCGKQMTCTASDSCWCAQFPHIPLSIDTENCLCKACLEIKIAESVNNGDVQLSKAQIDQIAQLEVNNPLIKGVDFDYNEEGLLMFSKWYHLKRGYCCNNSCINCPFPT